jgi:hypothetical protein
MTEIRSASQRISDEVTSWDGVVSGYGKRGEFGFRLNGHEVGHLHGDHAAHFSFGSEIGTALKEQGRVGDHPVFPGKAGPAARRIETDQDVQEVIELMRLNYYRIIARYGMRSVSATT